MSYTRDLCYSLTILASSYNNIVQKAGILPSSSVKVEVDISAHLVRVLLQLVFEAIDSWCNI